MGEPEVDPPSAPAALNATPSQGRPVWVRGLACLAMIPLLGFIGLTGSTLWGEWNSLRQDQVDMRSSAVVGYVDINPEVSYAASPDDWFHDEGEESLLWAGWKHQENHWFRFGRGDIDVHQLTLPIGRDAIRAIDCPIYEQDGGPRWERIPPEAPVVGFEQDGSAVAYPIKLLSKVLVVNDQLGPHPVLIAYSPANDAVAIFEGSLDGRRVTLGHGGYFRGSRPILYDRGTQSLWNEGEGGMVALAGRRKGTSLKLIAKLDVVTWSDWSGRHPGGRLVIGADRSKGIPAD
jgi:Protein of unknown function (DUF3179)